MSAPTLDTAKRKRAKYVANTIRFELARRKHLGPDDPIVFVSTIGQLRFIRQMLTRVAR